MSQPNIQIGGFIKNYERAKDMRSASLKPVIKKLNDIIILEKIRIQNVRNKLKEAVLG